MLFKGNYLITIAEMGSYAEDTDKVFTLDEHERLKQHLAFFPTSGDEVAGADGVRKLQWICRDVAGSREVQVIYFFHDTSMPLFLLTVASEGEFLDFDDELRRELATIVASLLHEFGKARAHAIKPSDSA